MSIFDVLTNGTLGSVIDTITKQAKTMAGGNLGSVLDTISTQARSAATGLRDATPGGLGGLAGAGALGAILGNVLQGDLMKSVAMAGAGAVAWNFYKKWAAGQQAGNADAQARQAPPAQSIPAAAAGSGWGNLASPPKIDPTAELVMRAMIYAARSDGNIDATEQNRIDQILHNMLPGEDVSRAVEIIRTENIDPAKIASLVHSPEQAEDVYRLSCAVIDVDNFMEKSYLDALSKSLGITPQQKNQLEMEANQAKSQLHAAISAG